MSFASIGGRNTVGSFTMSLMRALRERERERDRQRARHEIHHIAHHHAHSCVPRSSPLRMSSIPFAAGPFRMHRFRPSEQRGVVVREVWIRPVRLLMLVLFLQCDARMFCFLIHRVLICFSLHCMSRCDLALFLDRLLLRWRFHHTTGLFRVPAVTETLSSTNFHDVMTRVTRLGTRKTEAFTAHRRDTLNRRTSRIEQSLIRDRDDHLDSQCYVAF